MLKVYLNLLHVLLLPFVKYVKNAPLPLNAQQLYDFRGDRFDKTVDVKTGETIKLLKDTTVEVKIEYRFPNENDRSTIKNPFVMKSALGDIPTDHYLDVKYTYTLCNKTEVIYKGTNAKLTSDVEIKTGSNFCVSIMKELCNIFVNNQHDLDGFEMDYTYCLKLKDDCENYKIEIVKNNPNDPDDAHFEIKNSNDSVSGFQQVKFPFKTYILDYNLITCGNSTLDIFFTHNKNVLIAPKNYRSLIGIYNVYNIIFTISNEHSVAEIKNDTTLELSDFYEESDANELYAIVMSLKDNETQCDVETLHKIFYHYIYIKMHKLENVCKGIKEFLKEFEENRNNLETALNQFSHSQDKNIRKRTQQLFRKCYLVCDMKQCIVENIRCIKDKVENEVVKTALDNSSAIYRKIFKYIDQFDNDDRQIYDEWELTDKTLGSYEANVRSLS